MRDALLTTIQSDSHMWNLILLQMHLEELGYVVNNLGSCVPIELLDREVRAGAYDIVVVSTVNGHGYLDGVEIGLRLAELPQRQRMKLVIGGKLGLELKAEPYHARSLIAAGFDGVFYGPSALSDFDAFLQTHLDNALSCFEQAA